MILELIGLCLGVGVCAFWWGYTYGVEHGTEDAVKRIKATASETVEHSMQRDGWVKP